jgi:hypothetical protein
MPTRLILAVRDDGAFITVPGSLERTNTTVAEIASRTRSALRKQLSSIGGVGREIEVNAGGPLVVGGTVPPEVAALLQLHPDQPLTLDALRAYYARLRVMVQHEFNGESRLVSGISRPTVELNVARHEAGYELWATHAPAVVEALLPASEERLRGLPYVGQEGDIALRHIGQGHLRIYITEIEGTPMTPATVVSLGLDRTRTNVSPGDVIDMRTHMFGAVRQALGALDFDMVHIWPDA